MDYPHGRHHGRDRREEEYPPPGRPHPPPFYGEDEPPPPQVYHSSHTGPGPERPHPPPFYGENYPPPPQVYHTSHTGPGPERPQPPSFYGGNDPPPPQVYHTSHTGPGPEQPYPPPFYGGNDPPPPQVYHTSHSGPGPDSYPSPPPPSFSNYSPPPPAAEDAHHRPHMPHMPSIFDHHNRRKEDDVANKPSVRVYSKAETNYSLTIRDGHVILTRSDPSDPLQHWIKDERLSTKVKDEEGFPSFALINKATGQALKHSIGATHPVQLIPYNANVLDESILWTESKDLGDGYRTIRMINNIKLNVDAFNGDQNHGGVHEGTKIVLWEWKKGDNQRWKIVPY